MVTFGLSCVHVILTMHMMIGHVHSEIRSKFNPEVLSQNHYSSYINDPVSVSPVHKEHISHNYRISNLIHFADVPGSDVVIGLALYPNFRDGFRRFVGSLRYFGYDGHIMLGVNPDIPQDTLSYLKEKKTTLYGVVKSDCHPSAVGGDVTGAIRGKCSLDIADLKLEWGRFEMARRWLNNCTGCTGWVLVMDTRDSFFQAHPVRPS